MILAASVVWFMILSDPSNAAEPFISYGPMTRNDCVQFSRRTPKLMKSFCRSIELGKKGKAI